MGKYEKAIAFYKKTMPRNPGKANFFIAECYRLSNRLKEAEPYYAKAGGKLFDKDTIQYNYAQSLKANGKYEEANKQFEEILARTTNDKIKDRVNAAIDGDAYIKKLKDKPNYYRIKNLEALNTTSGEFSPVFLNNELYFTSSRGKGKIYEATNTPFTDLFKVSSRGANVDLATLELLPSGINEEIRNEACVTFTPDGKTMVFAKGNSEKKKGGVDVDLYISRLRNNVWSTPVLVPGLNTKFKKEDDVDAKNYSWDSTPAFSQDGRTLYFASNRRGGYGGNDLYSIQLDSRGRFTNVKNLGPEINTPGDEMFPYVSEDAKLYFSSDGHPGFGGLDLFVVKRVDGKTVIENLNQPMNSTADDFGIFLFKPDRGFFSSNRDGGKGDDDIYTFVNEDPDLKVVNYYLHGIAYSTDPQGKLQILPNTKVNLLDANGEIMQDYQTGADGKFKFRVYENEDYSLLGELEGYLVKRETYSTRGKSVDPRTLKELITNITLDTMIVLDKIELNKPIVLENIYYDFAKYYIRPDAALELDKLVQLLVDNPDIRIELSSHTDSVDDEEYNRVLSQRRAEAAVNYLIKKGIAAERITPKGYGESKPIARNTNPDGTDNPVGRQKNRRTEFKILEVGVLPKSKEEGEQAERFDEDKYFK